MDRNATATVHTDDNLIVVNIDRADDTGMSARLSLREAASLVAELNVAIEAANATRPQFIFRGRRVDIVEHNDDGTISIEGPELLFRTIVKPDALTVAAV